MKDELQKAKSELLVALRKIEATAPKAKVRKLEKSLVILSGYKVKFKPVCPSR